VGDNTWDWVIVQAAMGGPGSPSSGSSAFPDELLLSLQLVIKHKNIAASVKRSELDLDIFMNFSLVQLGSCPGARAAIAHVDW
jgi:hypothetical protein